MTVAQGYPDYSRLTEWSDQILVNLQNVSVASPNTSSVFYVANVHSLYFFVSVGITAVDVQINWYTDASALNIVSGQAFTVGPGQSFSRTMRPRGPYVKIILATSSGAAITGTFLFTTTTAATFPLTDINSPVLISAESQPIAANTTTTNTASFVWVGAAHVQAHTDGTTWSWAVHLTDYQGIVKWIAGADQATGRRPHLIYLPPGIITVSITNGDNGAHNYWMSLVGDGGAAG